MMRSWNINFIYHILDEIQQSVSIQIIRQMLRYNLKISIFPNNWCIQSCMLIATSRPTLFQSLTFSESNFSYQHFEPSVHQCTRLSFHSFYNLNFRWPTSSCTPCKEKCVNLGISFPADFALAGICFLQF